MPDPCLLTATQLAAAYRARSLSPVDVVDALLARIAARDPVLHSFVEIYADDSRLAARDVDKAMRDGALVGPLHGIPIALKDLIEIEGRQVTAGSAVHLGRKATTTATLARKLAAAGAIVLGKTHTVEFAFGGWGTNTHLGAPRNPWDKTVHRAPGGSSSGSGVAVAARLTPLAIGTDTGGSVRIPASFNGLTGLKVTRGRISNHGIVPLSVTLDSPGPMTRSVDDAAMLYNALQGPDPLDPLSRGILPDDPMPGLRGGVAGLRLGRLSEAQIGVMHPETAAAYEAALETMAGLGAVIVPVTLPRPLNDYAKMLAVLHAEAYAAHGHLADDPESPIGPHTRTRLLMGRYSARDYLTLLWSREAMAAEFLAKLDGVDALLTPTTLAPAPPIDSVDESGAPSELTRFANLLGLCALALPSGMTDGGLPLSLQIICRGLDEALVLRIGWAFEQAGPWAGMMPRDF
jgi:aspartyl-tRNA(Asn)/glutamyl-tRNA(Gln) amidotransferase subunit A